jgi:hypothetical protein
MGRTIPSFRLASVEEERNGKYFAMPLTNRIEGYLTDDFLKRLANYFLGT